MKFKVIETLEELERRYLLREADEEDTQDEKEQPEDDSAPEDEGDDMGEDDMEAPDQGGMPQEEPQQNDPNDPEIQAEPETGTFISDNRKAEIAKTMLDAYMASLGDEQGSIPVEYQNVTIDNADQVINFVTNQLKIDQGTNEKNISKILNSSPI